MIITAGLSPAWQHVLVFDGLIEGEVNRAVESFYAASGKVLNAARAVAILGGDGLALTVAGGAIGDALAAALGAEGIRHELVRTATWTRTCTSLIDRGRGRVTELVENAGALTATELAAFHAAFRSRVSPGDLVVLMGSLPAGAPVRFFRDLVSGLDIRVLADIRGPELLELLDTRPFLVKPNRAELERTLDRDLGDQAELRRAAGELRERGAEWVLVSDGPRGLLAVGPGEAYRLTPPRSTVVSPIGSGDVLAGALAVGLAHERPVPHALREAVACAVANLATPVPGRFDPALAQRLVDSVLEERPA